MPENGNNAQHCSVLFGLNLVRKTECDTIRKKVRRKDLNGKYEVQMYGERRLNKIIAYTME